MDASCMQKLVHLPLYLEWPNTEIKIALIVNNGGRTFIKHVMIKWLTASVILNFKRCFKKVSRDFEKNKF